MCWFSFSHSSLRPNSPGNFGPNAAEGATTPGRRLCQETWETWQAGASIRRQLYACGDPAPCWAMAHRQARQARAMATTTCWALWPVAMRWRDRWQRRIWAWPAEGLERGRELCQAPWQVPPAVGWLPIGPGSCAQGTPGMRLPGLGHTPLLTPRPTGLGRGGESQRRPQRSGGREACQGAQCRHGRHGHRARDPAQGLEGFAHWSAAPGGDRRVARAFQTAQTCRLCGNGLAGCLQDDLRRRGGTHHRAAPAQGGGTPVGPPRSAARVPQHKRCQPPLGGLPIPEGRFPRPPQARIAASSRAGTETGVRSPERRSRASGKASRRSVVTRSPAFVGMQAGAPTQQPASV